MDDLTEAQRIELGTKLLSDLREAHRRGVDPIEIMDERNGSKLARSSGWPCTLLQWTDLEGDHDDLRDENELGRAHVGMKGVTLYATNENETYVRFADGVKVWCRTTDLLID
ncbi:MAG: hypothetical protein ACXWQ5_00570 [Ktedonobacterales bacterium]